MYPDWVEKHRTKGTNISQVKGRFYLYKVSSVWDKQKGRARKITEKYLGRITEQGLLPSKKHCAATIKPNPSIKEFGCSSTLTQIGKDITENLAAVFGEESAAIAFALAFIRTVEHAPFKRMEHFYNHSFISELLTKVNVSPKNISLFLQQLGNDRQKIARFMRNYVDGNKHILIDSSAITSKSEKLNINRVGYNSNGSHDPQINLLYIFSYDNKSPAYYRILPGNIRDVSAFKLAITESGVRDTVIVADKGFASEANFALMDELGLEYVIPLKRNSSLFDAGVLESGNKARFEGFFMYNKRPIWYYRSNTVVVYLDNDLRNEEEKDYLTRLESDVEGYTMEEFMSRQHRFGTIVMRTNLSKPAEDIYAIYKERAEIEQSFDFLKNLMEQDKTYMQNESSLEAWAFINHISLMLNYRIYRLLREKKLLKKYSVGDFFAHLKYIFKINSGGEWITSEISQKTKKLLRELQLHIT